MAEAAQNDKQSDSLLECPVCLNDVINHRVLPCQHLFCQTCLEPIVTDGAITCPVCRNVCHLYGKSVDTLPRNLLLMSLLDKLCESCKQRDRDTQCSHCHKWMCVPCYQSCRAEVKQKLQSLDDESTKLNAKEKQTMKLVVDDIVRINNQFVGTSDRIDKNVDSAIEQIRAKQKELKVALQRNRQGEIERLQARYDLSAEHTFKLSDFSSQYKQELQNSNDVADLVTLATLSKRWECHMRTFSDIESTPSLPDLHKHVSPQEINVQCTSNCGTVQVLIRTSARGDQLTEPGDSASHGSLGNVSNSMDYSALAPAPDSPGLANTSCSTKSSSVFFHLDSAAQKTNQVPEPDTTTSDGPDVDSSVISNISLSSSEPDSTSLENAFCQSEAQTQSAHRSLVSEQNSDNKNTFQTASSVHAVTADASGAVPRVPVDYTPVSHPHGAVYGSMGSGDGCFDFPSFVAVSPVTRNIVVTDVNNHRVQILNDHGQFLRHFGTRGTNWSQFNFNNNHYEGGISVTPGGLIVVADTGNDRVQIFDELGTFIRAFGSTGNRHGQLKTPIGLTVDLMGNIYVCEFENKRIQVFDQTGRVLRVFGSTNTMGKWHPYDIAVCSSGIIVVVDSNEKGSKIHIFGDSGQHIRSIKKAGSTHFKLLQGIAVNSYDNIVVTDTTANLVYIVTQNGDLIKMVGEGGPTAKQLDSPCGVTCTMDGRIIVVDTDNNNLQIIKIDK